MSVLKQCKVVQSIPHYFVLEGTPAYFSNDQISQAIQEMVEKKFQHDLKSISVICDESELNFGFWKDELLKAGFQLKTRRLQFERSLDTLEKKSGSHEITWQKTEDAQFQKYWMLASKDSLNKPDSVSIDNGLFEGLKEELGSSYGDHCLIGCWNGRPIGISIPHIEPGTAEEGRLFFLGLFPEYRGQGLGRYLHLQSLIHLKRIGARNYIGMTDERNIPMQKLFIQNGCPNTRTISVYWINEMNKGDDRHDITKYRG